LYETRDTEILCWKVNVIDGIQLISGNFTSQSCSWVSSQEVAASSSYCSNTTHLIFTLAKDVYVFIFMGGLPYVNTVYRILLSCNENKLNVAI